MRIAVITPRYPPDHTGGGGLSVQLLAEELVTNPQVSSVKVFTFGQKEITTDGGVTVERLGPHPRILEVANVQMLRRLWDCIGDFDYLHSYNMELHPACGYLGMRSSVKTVASLNNYTFIDKSLSNENSNILSDLYNQVYLRSLGRPLIFGIQQIDAFIALSQSVKDTFTSSKIKNMNISVVPNMADPDFFEEPTPSHNDGSTCNLLFVGNLEEHKGVNDLVESLQYLSDEYFLRVVGTGSCHTQLVELAEEFDISDRIQFVGSVPHDEVKEHYELSDVFIHPATWKEPFSRTVLEAMQYGLPIVATELGGSSEVIPQKELLVRPNSPKQIAKKIRQAREDRDRISQENFDHVRNTYYPSQVVPQILSVYDSI